MTIKETMQGISNVLMNKIQMGISYSWGDELFRREAEKTYSFVKKQLKDIIGPIDQLTEENLKDLGFKVWDKDEKEKLYLMPLWFFDLIPDGTEIISINNIKAIKGKDEIDLDIRCNCIAYGFTR